MSAHKVPHVVQRTDWDCGLACVEMVIRYFYQQNFDQQKFSEICYSLHFGDNIWSIDLVNILVNYGIDCIYHTITYGVDAGYREQPYYKHNFDHDQTRVNKLFENADKLGLNIIKSSVPLKDILMKLDDEIVAIVLIDANKLQCKTCEYPTSDSDMSYCGHYILLYGYNNKEGLFYYQNPSRTTGECCTDFECFKLAWHSYGTDNDIIFINLKQSITKL